MGDIKLSKDLSLETLQRSHKLAPAKVKIVAKLRLCAKYDAPISSPPPLTYMFTSFGMSHGIVDWFLLEKNLFSIR